jgi:uncharacterized membrane protein YuzA (DUF378 family)
MESTILYVVVGIIALYIIGSWINNWRNLNKK